MSLKFSFKRKAAVDSKNVLLFPFLDSTSSWHHLTVFIVVVLIHPQFDTKEGAQKCREALHGATWPQSNPKTLHIEFATQSEVSLPLRIAKLL